MTDAALRSDGTIRRGVAIGRYVVQRFIARGAMGEVYAAYDPELDRKVAIKLVRVDDASAGDLDSKARFMREAQAIAKLSHPSVIVVHDVGTFEDRVFIAMELIDGCTLGHWLRSQPRTWREVLRVFIAAGRGLHHAHEANLVHRDFKPDNVMIRVDGQVRVTDFGLVRSAAAEQTPTEDNLPAAAPTIVSGVDLGGTVVLSAVSAQPGGAEVKLTETGVVMGTPSYMAPEQFFSRPADARSDQFSFCVALYEGLFGKKPFAGATISALTSSVVSGAIEPPPERTEVPVIVWQALRRGLSVSPHNRYPSMHELLTDLGRYPEPPRRKLPSDGKLASAADLASLLETLLRRPVQAKQQQGKARCDHGVVAVYAAEDEVPAALVHFDLTAAGSIAAALTSAPPNVVREAVGAGKLPRDLLDNLLEVANVLTKVVRGMSATRLRIQRLYPLRSAPPDISTALETPPCFVTFDVAMSEYPGGKVTVIGLGPKVADASRAQETVLTRALVVDDSGAMRLVVGRALARLGVADLLEAANGKEALKSLRRNPAIQAVFVDWSMPVMDGVTFVKTVRADKRLDGVRLVMVTTEEDPAQMEAAFAAGADDYLVKPISDELLRSRLAGIGLKTS